MNLTKNAIIDAFWLLLDEKPYNKITVKDIVNRCQINRNTFYYHFHDIPELLETAVKNDTDQIIHTYSKGGSLLEFITYFIDHSLDRKRAILHIYRSVFREYFINELDRIVLYAITKYMDTVDAQHPIHPDDKLLLIRFYKCLSIGILLDWLNDGMQYDLSRYISRIGALFHGAVEQAYETALQSVSKKP